MLHATARGASGGQLHFEASGGHPLLPPSVATAVARRNAAQEKLAALQALAASQGLKVDPPRQQRSPGPARTPSTGGASRLGQPPPTVAPERSRQETRGGGGGICSAKVPRSRRLRECNHPHCDQE
jgi:hypothetical protein